MERADRLLAAYLDRELTAAEAEELLALVRGTPALRDDFLSLTRLDRQLAAELGPIDLEHRVTAALGITNANQASGSDTQWVERVMGNVRRVRRPDRPRPGSPRPNRNRSPVPWLLSVAAGLLAAAATLWWMSVRPVESIPSAPPVAVQPSPVPPKLASTSVPVPVLVPVPVPIAIATSTGVVLRANTVLTSGTVIHAGDELYVGSEPGGWTYTDGTTIATGAKTTAVLDGNPAVGKRIALRDGSITASVVPQPEGQPLVATTRHLEATVLGTRFSLEVAAVSRLAVREGQVLARIGSVSSVIGAGQEISAGASGVRVVDWSATGRWDEFVTAGVARPAGAGAEAALISVATTPDQCNRWFDPDQQICIQGAKGMGRVELVRLPPGFRLHLTLRAEKVGEAMATMEVLSATTKPAGLGSRRFAVGPAWSEVILAAEDFACAATERSVRTISLWSFGVGVLELSSLSVERSP